MEKRSLSIFAILFCIIGLPSCIKMPKYRRRPLESLSSRFEYVGTNNKVIAHAKRLNNQEAEYLFGKRGTWLALESNQEPLYPIYLSFHNLSNTSYVLSPKNISLELEPHHQATKRLQTSSTGKAAGTIATGGIASLITAGGGLYAWFAGATIGSAALIFGAKAALITVPIILIGTPIIALIKSIRSSRTNRTITRDIKEKSLHTDVTIYPGQQFDTLVFVKRPNYRTNFDVTLHQSDNPDNTISFNISLGQHRFITQIAEQ